MSSHVGPLLTNNRVPFAHDRHFSAGPHPNSLRLQAPNTSSQSLSSQSNALLLRRGVRSSCWVGLDWKRCVAAGPQPATSESAVETSHPDALALECCFADRTAYVPSSLLLPSYSCLLWLVGCKAAPPLQEAGVKGLQTVLLAQRCVRPWWWEPGVVERTGLVRLHSRQEVLLLAWDRFSAGIWLAF